MMQIARIYTDEQGESHFEDQEVTFNAVDYAPPAPPIDISAPYEASQTFLLHLGPGWEGAAHASPQRQIGVNITGEIELGVSDGERRTFGPGAVILFEDTNGKGHGTRNAGDGEILMAMTQLADS